MKYEVFFEKSHLHLIRIKAESAASANLSTTFLLSAWRPGRYELGPYIENICEVKASTIGGKTLQVTKISNNAFQVEPSGNEKFFLDYKYYAVDRGAGGSNFDASQIYINPINLFVYQEAKVNEACEVFLNLPPGYKIACGMKQDGTRLFAADFHELADCPIFAAKEMLHLQQKLNNIPFHLWFLGQVKLDSEKVLSDFGKFIQAQIELFGSFPANEYHFLFQMMEMGFHHGVEHQNSTVISIGPTFTLMKNDLYEEFLGISSHELFHAWNVKAIRPADMQPYIYEKANYSRLHYITEGVTTYYGDLMLLKAGVRSLEDFVTIFNDTKVKRHYAGDGHKYISLEESSFDSWINGYKETVPGRKISFYNKGALVAFILDYRIRKATRNNKSLDDVMRQMFERFGKTGIGYTREDYQSVAESVSGISHSDYFRDFISGIIPIETELKEAASYFGLNFIECPSGSISQRRFGYILESNEDVKVVYEGSPAEKAGLEKGDHVIAINGIELKSENSNDVLGFLENETEFTLSFFRKKMLKEVKLVAGPDYSGLEYKFEINSEATKEQIANCKAWMESDNHRIKKEQIVV